MLPKPAITTVIAACGIVTFFNIINSSFNFITTVIAACGIVTTMSLTMLLIKASITTVIAACGIVTMVSRHHSLSLTFLDITTVIAACGIVTGTWGLLAAILTILQL